MTPSVSLKGVSYLLSILVTEISESKTGFLCLPMQVWTTFPNQLELYSQGTQFCLSVCVRVYVCVCMCVYMYLHVCNRAGVQVGGKGGREGGTKGETKK